MSVLVAVPCYNDGRFAGNFFDKLYSQDYDDYKVVVCNDASNEETSGILERARAKYGFDLITNSGNQGIGYSLNNAIFHGIKKYNISHITWFGIDDVPYSNYISRFMQEFEKTDFDAIFSRYHGVGMSNLAGKIVVDPKSLKVGYGLGTSYMYTKDVFLMAGPYVPLPQEDYPFFVRAAALGFKFGKIDEALMGYCWRGDAVSFTRVNPRFNGTIIAKEMAKKFL